MVCILLNEYVHCYSLLLLDENRFPGELHIIHLFLGGFYKFSFLKLTLSLLHMSHVRTKNLIGVATVTEEGVANNIPCPVPSFLSVFTISFQIKNENILLWFPNYPGISFILLQHFVGFTVCGN